MNTFGQHIPAFVDGVTPVRFDFETTEDLLAHPHISSWAEDVDGWKFYRFSLAEDSLMAEYDGGTHWWVIGRIAHPEQVALPVWKAVYKQ